MHGTKLTKSLKEFKIKRSKWTNQKFHAQNEYENNVEFLNSKLKIMWEINYIIVNCSMNGKKVLKGILTYSYRKKNLYGNQAYLHTF